MSHINYNHLYYFWHVYKEGSVVGAAEALFLTPQTITVKLKPWKSVYRGSYLNVRDAVLNPANWASWFFAMRTKCLR